jgi:cell division protein ZipA
MSPRELVILILGLAIVAVILRGLYVAIQSRRGQIRLAIDKEIPKDISLDDLEMTELPNGGARIKPRNSLDAQSPDLVATARSRASEMDLGDDQDSGIPVLMDVVQVEEPDSGSFAAVEEASADDLDDDLYIEDEQSIPERQTQPIARSHEVSSESFDEDAFDITDEIRAHESAADAIQANSAEAEAEFESSHTATDAERFEDRQDLESAATAGDDDEEEGEAFWEEEQTSSARREPSLDTQTSFEDSLDEFSMSAGERIGSVDRPKKSGLSKQSDLLDDDVEYGAEEGGSSTPESVKPRSRFSIAAITRRLEKSKRASEQSENEVKTDQAEAFAEDESHGAVDLAPENEEIAAQSDLLPSGEDLQEPNMVSSKSTNRSRSGGEKIAPSEPSVPAIPSEVLVLNVMAREGRAFSGDELLEALITAGLKFGDMNIFHKRIGPQGKGVAVFSVANILNPGTFDLNTISEFSTVGVSLFMALPTPINNLEAFELMISTARNLQAQLDADLRDDHRNMLTAQTIEHYRQRIRDFELRQLKVAGSRA